jgi:DNA-binding NarL/FixJ family response regulator
LHSLPGIQIVAHDLYATTPSSNHPLENSGYGESEAYDSRFHCASRKRPQRQYECRASGGTGHPSDVALISGLLPDDGVFELIRRIEESRCAQKVLVTDLTRTTDLILNVMEEGAAGYVCCDESVADLVKKIRAVHEDEFLICPEIATALMARVAELKQLVHELDCTAFVELTPREQEVLELIGQGMSNREIADKLIVELGTVKNHVHNLLRKLDVSNREQAAQFAAQILGKEPAV